MGGGSKMKGTKMQLWMYNTIQKLEQFKLSTHTPDGGLNIEERLTSKQRKFIKKVHRNSAIATATANNQQQ